VKGGFGGKHVADNDAVIVAIKKWLLEADATLTREGCRLWSSDGENVYEVVVNMW
jgi:hypothetical protein